MNINQIEKKLKSVDYDATGYSLVVEIEDWAIDFGVDHDLAGSGMLSPKDEYTHADPVFDEFLTALHKLKGSKTPKQFYRNKEFALAWWHELEENVQ